MGKVAKSNKAWAEKTVILEDAVLDGDMNLSGDLCLSGKISGNVTAGGRVDVTAEGVVTGNVSCRELCVAGIVAGDVVTRTLRIGEGAVLKGNVEVSTLCLDGENYDIKWLRLVKK